MERIDDVVLIAVEGPDRQVLQNARIALVFTVGGDGDDRSEQIGPLQRPIPRAESAKAESRQVNPAGIDAIGLA